jgi:D-alanyl-D-alanine carboxypeptidase
MITRRSMLAGSLLSGSIANPLAAQPAKATEAKISAMKSQLGLQQVWFRLESKGVPPVVIDATSNANEAVAIGSISKSLTALAVAVLIQENRLGLDSNLKDVLGNYFASRRRKLDASLHAVTIRRLLTHTAGLPANFTSDPVHGINNGKMMPYLSRSTDFWDYATTARADVSDGSTGFRYSNISFLILGEVIEAVTGEPYENYCQRAVLQPLGITSATIPRTWRVIAPFAGWFLTPKDAIALWNAFDISMPRILSRQTLNTLLVTPLAAPVNDNLYYALGLNIRRSAAGTEYVLAHNGISDLVPDTSTYFAYMQKAVPGPTWFIGVSPLPSRSVQKEIPRSINSVVGLTR